MDQQRLVDVLRRFAGTLTGEFELVDVFERLSDEIRATLDVEGAGVMLADTEGNLRFTSSDDPLLAELERLQISLDEGPCLAAYRAGERIIASDLKTDERFPEFGPRAVEVGLRAVYSFPMRWEDQVVGAINFYGADRSGLTDEQIRSAETLADIATAYLVHGRQYDEVNALATQLQGALDSRIPIEQAKGFVAARLDLSVEEAFSLLRSYARSHSRRFADVAVDVVNRRLSVDDLAR
jgi:GAF domain-containing protein